MHRELKLTEWVCEFCGKKTIVSNAKIAGSDSPPDWGVHLVHGCGMTGYTKEMDACEVCSKKTMKFDKDRYWLE